MDLSPDLVALLRDQHGVATRRQLADHGVTREALRWRLGRQWHLALPGVVSVVGVPLEGRSRLVAAMLYAGPGAALTGPAAARWWGLTDAPTTADLDLLVPVARPGRSSGDVHVRRTTRPDPRQWESGPLRLVSPARAVADSPRLHPRDRDSEALVIQRLEDAYARALERPRPPALATPRTVR